LTENDNERRAMMAFVLCLAVYFVWTSIYYPSQPVAVVADVPAAAEGGEVAPGPVPAAPDEPVVDSTPAAVPANVVAVPDRTEEFSSQFVTGDVHSSEGAIHSLHLNDYTVGPTVTPLYSWVLGKFTGGSGSWEPYVGGDEPYTMLSEHGGLVLVGAGALDPFQGYTIRKDGDALIATYSSPDGLSVVKTYTPSAVEYILDVSVTFTNNTGQSISDLWVGIVEEMSGDAGRFQNEVRPIAHVEDDIVYYDSLEDLDGTERETTDASPAWFGIGDRYFMSVLLPAADAGIGRLIVDDVPGDEDRYGAFGFTSTPLDAGATREITLQAYIGPKQLDILKGISPELADAVELGWFGFFAVPLLFLLKIFQSVVINWGVAILLLTLTVKLAFFPLTQRAFKSSRMMQALQPELKELREKYKDDQQLQSQETMKLFKERGVNPLGGCLPTLIQLPVWIALYNVMLYSVELYDSSFLYLMDLTKEDPYGALPVIYALLILGQQQLMPMGNMDPTQRQVMKLMPLMFAAFMFTFPSGLVLYFCCNILLTIGQQFLINRTIKIETPTEAEPEAEAS
jgi:YidC/Oxa1 family membrane protein insertase